MISFGYQVHSCRALFCDRACTELHIPTMPLVFTCALTAPLPFRAACLVTKRKLKCPSGLALPFRRWKSYAVSSALFYFIMFIRTIVIIAKGRHITGFLTILLATVSVSRLACWLITRRHVKLKHRCLVTGFSF